MPMRIGVCSWSLQPTSPQDLLDKLRAVGASAVQLALGPERHAGVPSAEFAAALRAAGVTVASGMSEMKDEDYSSLATIRVTGGVRPDENWDDNLRISKQHARMAGEYGLRLVTFHAGFLPHDPRDAERGKMIQRLRTIIDQYAEFGVRVGFETGQESADTLLGVLDELDRPTVGVNFDPANMILYDMGDPIESLRKLAPRVLQVHIKDARRATTPGAWGDQTPIGSGEVDWAAFFEVLHERRVECDLMIEREAGGNRIPEVAQAVQFVGRLLAAGE